MKRMLSHILLFTLLVIAPVSFSTEEIPSFDVPATHSSPFQESRKADIAVVRQAVELTGFLVVSFSPPHCFNSLPKLSINDFRYEIEHGRAPPVVPSV